MPPGRWIRWRRCWRSALFWSRPVCNSIRLQTTSHCGLSRPLKPLARLFLSRCRYALLALFGRLRDREDEVAWLAGGVGWSLCNGRILPGGSSAIPAASKRFPGAAGLPERCQQLGDGRERFGQAGGRAGGAFGGEEGGPLLLLLGVFGEGGGENDGKLWRQDAATRGKGSL